MGLGEQVRSLITLHDRETAAFFGGPPYSAEIQRILDQTSRYDLEGYPSRPRVATGSCVFDGDGRVIGYQETTIMNRAEPTAYERAHLHLRDPLEYVQMKKILVHPEHCGNGVSTRLLTRSMMVAMRLGKDWCTDVSMANKRMISFLEKNNIRVSRTWMTPNGTTMYRFKWEYD